jgi:hypothetical protein
MSESEKLNALLFLRQTGSRDTFFQALMEAQAKTGHQQQLAGYAGARKATSLGADAARRTVLGQGERMQADATQGLISRGLIGTSAGTGEATDLAGQTTQQLANIDQQLAAAFANLGLEEGNVKKRQSDELAQLLGTGREFQRELGILRTDFAPSDKGIGGIFTQLASHFPGYSPTPAWAAT